MDEFIVSRHPVKELILNVKSHLAFVFCALILLSLGCSPSNPDLQTESAKPASPTSPPLTISPQATEEKQPDLKPPSLSTIEPPTLDLGCIADPSQLPEEIDPDSDVWENIWSFLMRGDSTSELEEILNSLCGSILGFGEEPIIASVIEADVNVDGRQDVLLSLTLPYGGGIGESHVVTYMFGGGGIIEEVLFRRAGAGSRAEGLYAGGGGEFLAIHDMNLNGIPEIVFAIHWDDMSEFYISEWSESVFVSLIEYYSELEMVNKYAAFLPDGYGEIVDIENDGFQELVLVTSLEGMDPEARPPLERREVWAWDGSQFSIRESLYQPDPVYRFEAVLMGDFAFFHGDIDQALAFYQQAVFDEELFGWSLGHDIRSGQPATPDPDERERLNGYGRYRIMLTHAYRRYENEVEIVFENLKENIQPQSPGYPFVELAQVFLESYQTGGNFYEACSVAIQYAESQVSDLLDPLGQDFYGVYGRDYEPQDICPYPRQS